MGNRKEGGSENGSENREGGGGGLKLRYGWVDACMNESRSEWMNESKKVKKKGGGWIVKWS